MTIPIRGAVIYFKTMFLHPVRFEPVVAWRWGKITEIHGKDVVIEVLGPKYHDEDEEELEEGELEEGEIQSLEEKVRWGELMDVRLRV